MKGPIPVCGLTNKNTSIAARRGRFWDGRKSESALRLGAFKPQAPPASSMNAEKLRGLVLKSLRQQGFTVRKGAVVPPPLAAKETIRNLHATAVFHRIERSEPYLRSKETALLTHIASGREVDPEKINPRLVLVRSDSEEELLFRYATLHWSVPVSSGYGRRLRYIVRDEHNGKLIGVFGLGDPVINLRARDEFVGWTPAVRRTRLAHVMDAFVLGAVPPYSNLLCGKLVAMLAVSNEVRRAFKGKYGGQRSRIRRQPFDGRLAMITTTSALGRSSLYNRLRFGEHPLFTRAGMTEGFGEFQFCNGLYSALAAYAKRYCDPSERKSRWGTGFRNRRELVRKCLRKIKLARALTNHGISREVYVAPLAANAAEFLRGEHDRLQWCDLPATRLFEFFRERWLLPRSQRDPTFREFHPAAWRLWDAQQS